MAEVELTGSGTAEVDPGDEVVVRLPENASTGYLWSVVSVGAGLELVGDATAPPAGGGPGAAGERVVRLRAAAPGRAVVLLRLARPWEPAPAEERQVTVTVR